MQQSPVKIIHYLDDTRSFTRARASLSATNQQLDPSIWSLTKSSLSWSRSRGAHQGVSNYNGRLLSSWGTIRRTPSSSLDRFIQNQHPIACPSVHFSALSFLRDRVTTFSEKNLISWEWEWSSEKLCRGLGTVFLCPSKRWSAPSKKSNT